MASRDAVQFSVVKNVSSEDPAHRAENLLSTYRSAPWVTAAGATSASIDLVLSPPSTLDCIDVGNNGSADVQVLASSDGTNFVSVAPVTAFPRGDSVASVTVAPRGPWAVIRLVCTSPTSPFGLAFVRGETEKEAVSKKRVFGGFSLAPSSAPAPPPLFSQRAQTAPSLPRARPVLSLRRAQPPASAQPFSSLTNTAAASSAPDASRKDAVRPTVVASASPRPVPASSSASPSPSSALPKAESKPANASPPSAPAAPASSQRPLHNVVFSISGLNNPERGIVRDKAVSLGAVYEPDVTPRLTHLLCAFSGTPKAATAQRVAPSAVCVKPEWIHACAREKKRVAEDEHLIGGQPSMKRQASSSSAVPDAPKRRASEEVRKPVAEIGDGAETEEDEDLTRSLHEQRKRMADGNVDTSIPLPDFFNGVNVFFYRINDAALLNKLRRYVVAYGGSVLEYMGDESTHVVSNGPWGADHDTAAATFTSTLFVTPQWILDCNKNGTRLKEAAYSLSPSAPL